MNKIFFLSAAFYLLSVFLNTLTAVFIKYLHLGNIFTLNQIISIRSIFSILLLTPFVLKSFKTIKYKDIWLIIFVGLLSVLDVYLWHNGVGRVNVNNAIVMSFLVPIFITFFAFFILKEAIYIGSIIALLVSFFALKIIYQTSSITFNIGYIILCVDFIVGALGFVLTKKLTFKYSSIFIVYLKILIIMPISLILIGSFPVFNFYSFLFIFACSIIYILERYFFTLSYKLYNMLPLQPLRFFNLIFSFFLSYIILHEEVSMVQIYAGLIVILANLINIFVKTKPINLSKLFSKIKTFIFVNKT